MLPNYYTEEKKLMPVLFTRSTVLFPNQILTLDLETPEWERIAKRCMEKDQAVLVLSLKDPSVEEPTLKDYESLGTIVKLHQNFNVLAGPAKLLAEGKSRGKLVRLIRKEPYHEAEVIEYLFDPTKVRRDPDLDLMQRLLSSSAMSFFKTVGGIPEAILATHLLENNPGFLADEVASHLDLTKDEAMSILECFDLYERMVTCKGCLDLQVRLSMLEKQITEEAQLRMQQSQKDFLLQEQMDIIRAELGERENSNDPSSLAEYYREKIKKLDMPKASKEWVLKEADKLSYLSPVSPDLNVSRTYLDTVLDLPWGKYKKEAIDMDRARKVLDEDHYGLKEVKERILEFIAVRKLKGDSKGSILCLAGPPGVGKTSIAKSMARAMKRDFTSMRLGGVTDEAEIRGHRKTYVGAMPGRIIAQMTKCKSMNPLFLFDEVDKIGSDYRGDPASALLEVLDPEQNSNFMDRYLEIPFDLSSAMFLTTANDITTIPGPLLDRMEVIKIPGYTDYEKQQIARDFLVKKQKKENGLYARQVQFTDKVIEQIIHYYTREAGVRELERQIGKICRKAAAKVVEGQKSVRISENNLQDFLGPRKYLDDPRAKIPRIGVVNGLAWTQTGGELLTVEASKMDGRGTLFMTGPLGDVMRQSAELAVSYIRANADRFAIPKGFLTLYDLHVHLSEGAVLKDGPSAGVSLMTALVSTLTSRPVKNTLAMTGEITLTGRVLRVDGIRDKVLAAKRYGITTVILPKENMRDLEEIEKEAIEEMHFIPVEQIDEVIREALLPPIKEEQVIVFKPEEEEGLIGFHPGKEEKYEKRPADENRAEKIASAIEIEKERNPHENFTHLRPQP